MFQCGLYGGSFNPLHLGHVRCIIAAASQCQRLIVVLSIGDQRDEIDARQRYRWLYQATSKLDNVNLYVIHDDAASKADYGEASWQADAALVKAFAGQPIDAVFCGSDYGRDSFWSRCYPEAALVTLPRDGISSSAIRADPLAHWDWLPPVVRPYYVRKVLIVGGESTGKSTLTANLANYYNTNFVPEVGRELSERSGTDQLMLPADFTDILLQHKTGEVEALKHSNRLLFEDTDCLTTLFYLGFLAGPDQAPNAALAEAIAGLNTYDLVLFLEPDVAFVQDGDRSPVIATDRERYSDQLKQIYRRHGLAGHTISGDYDSRFRQAVSLVDKLIQGVER